MKKIILFPAVFITAMLVQAKDVTVVVKGPNLTPKGNTEVTIHEDDGSDTLTVTPGNGITTITVTVRDLDGTLISQDVLSAAGDFLQFSTPQLSGGCVITLHDDDNVVYMGYDD